MGYCPASNPYHPLVNLGRVSIVLSTLLGRARPPRVAREARRCRDGEAGRGLPLRDGGEPRRWRATGKRLGCSYTRGPVHEVHAREVNKFTVQKGGNVGKGQADY